MKKILNKLLEKIDYKDVIIFLMPFMMFGVYLIILHPGVLSYDSYNQLWQIKLMTFNNSHPFFHTFIEMVLLKIVNTPAIIGLFQITFFSILWSRICRYNRIKFSKFSFQYQLLLTFWICLNPLNKVLSVTLWKDVLYSYIVLWFCFEMEKLIDKKFKLDLKGLIKLSFLLALMPNLRHNGYLITLVMGIVLFILFIIKDKKSLNYVCLFCFTLVSLLGFKGLEKIYKVEKGIFSVDSVIDYRVLAISGEIGRYGTYTEEEKNEINNYVDFDCMVERTKYNALDQMWVSCKGNPEAMRKNRISMYKTIFKMSLKNKKVVIGYLLKESGYVWRIVRYKDSWGNINYYGLFDSNAGELLYGRYFADSNIHLALTKYILFTRTNRVFQTMLYSGALCLYLSIILLIVLKNKYNAKIFLVFLPALVNLIGIALTATVNDVRYYYSNFLVFYLLTAIFLKYWLDDKKRLPKKINK